MISLLLCGACVSKSPEQEKAEKLVKRYVEKLCHNSSDCKISCTHFRPFYAAVEEEPEYEKFKDDRRKLDSLKKKFSPKIRGWGISVRFYGKNQYCVTGDHQYQIAIDKDISKIIVGVEFK